MDRLERSPELTALILLMQQSGMSELWTALPCILDSFNPDLQTCTAQPAVQVSFKQPGGDIVWVDIPLLVDVPVIFPGGGGSTLTFPMASGDELLVVFSSMCIDSWWYSGGYGNRPPDLRLHDLSDGFAIPKPRSRPRALQNFSMSKAQLRSDDGETYVELDPVGKIVNIVAPGGLTIDTTPSGIINLIGATNFTGTVSANGHRIDETHTHTGVTAGGGTSGPVT